MFSALLVAGLIGIIALLVALFAVQWRGTGRVSALFGPITTVWFVAISITLDYKNNHYAAAVGSSVLLFFIGIYFIAELIRKSKTQ